MNAEKFMNVVRRHTSFEELTPTLLREFVEKIVVHECSYDENKTRRQDIEIYYFFITHQQKLPEYHSFSRFYPRFIPHIDTPFCPFLYCSILGFCWIC